VPTRNLDLTDYLDALVEASITSGRHKNASEVVCEGLRLLEQRQMEEARKLECLREAVGLSEDALKREEFEELALDELGSYLAALGTKARRRTGA
jgi:antitoxin ParD1/3/4